MHSDGLRKKCKVNINYDLERFVGIKCIEGDIRITFPLGFRLGDDEKALKKDILLLLNVLANNTEQKESEINTQNADDEVLLPIYAYLYVINDYLARGNYKERENIYIKSKKGKINWGRTIKTQRPYIDSDDAYYLDFIARKSNVNENELITLIHEYCVFESFEKIGWLFTSHVPARPRIKFNQHQFVSVVKSKLTQTFNDRNKQLFHNMLKIILSLGDDGSSSDFQYGTNRFEYVWEKMIDKSYGIRNKMDYFPKTMWSLPQGKHENAYLEPDTIMIQGDTIYVLDAKYYKYGHTGVSSHLPDSTSINKQITYGEYIAEAKKFKDMDCNSPDVYNVFLMPYDSNGEKFNTGKEHHYIGTAYSNWKSSDGIKPYEQVVGILMDIKSLMKDYSHKQERIIRLAKLIEDSIAYRYFEG